MLTASIFDAQDLHISDHNPVIIYYDALLLSDAIKPARACHNTRRFLNLIQFPFLNGITMLKNWILFVRLIWFNSIHGLLTKIKAANAELLSITIGNTYAPKI